MRFLSVFFFLFCTVPVSQLFVREQRGFAVFWIRIVLLCGSVSGSREQKNIGSAGAVFTILFFYLKNIFDVMLGNKSKNGTKDCLKGCSQVYKLLVNFGKFPCSWIRIQE
jgi:hypothetical protein